MPMAAPHLHQALGVQNLHARAQTGRIAAVVVVSLVTAALLGISDVRGIIPLCWSSPLPMWQASRQPSPRVVKVGVASANAAVEAQTDGSEMPPASTTLIMRRDRGKCTGFYKVAFSTFGHAFDLEFERTLPDDTPAFGAVRLTIEELADCKVDRSWHFKDRVEVQQVEEESPAAKAGILPGDLIRAVTTFGEEGLLFPWMSAKKPSAGVRLELVDGKNWLSFGQIFDANSAVYGGDGTATLVIERPFNRGDKTPSDPWDFFDDGGDGWGGGPDNPAILVPVYAGV